MRAAYRDPDALRAQGRLEALAKELQRSHPGAAASLREGLAETLTVARLGVPPTLVRTLRSTNRVESMIEISATTPATSSAGTAGRWRCGGAEPACSSPQGAWLAAEGRLLQHACRNDGEPRPGRGRA